MRGRLLLDAFTLAGGAAILLLAGPAVGQDLLTLATSCFGQAPPGDPLPPLQQGGWLLLRAVTLLGAGVFGAGVFGAWLRRRWGDLFRE